MASEYEKKLKDPKWHKKRMHIEEIRDHKCEMCSKGPNGLTVHHGYYVPKGDPWDYPDDTLYLLCWPCHLEAQHKLARAQKILASIHPRDFEEIYRPLENLAHELHYGLSLDELEGILKDVKAAEGSQYSEYNATITSSSDLGPSIADQLESAASEEFPGLQIFLSHEENSPDGVTQVEGPDEAVRGDIQNWFDSMRERL